MKPNVNVVGNYVEGIKGGIILENWVVDGTQSDEPFTLDDLKQIAIANNTFEVREGKIIPGESAGVRWFGDDPFGN